MSAESAVGVNLFFLTFSLLTLLVLLLQSIVAVTAADAVVSCPKLARTTGHFVIERKCKRG